MKRIIFLMTLLMLVMTAQGQKVEGKKCGSCGKPLKECPYKGKHPQKQEAQQGNGDNRSNNKPNKRKSVVRLEGNTLRFTVDGREYSYNMVYVEGGTFTMGCTSEQGGECKDDEKPSHSVTLSSYYIGETEVTQALWKAVMGSNPSYWTGDNLPVEKVNYADVETFITKLNQKTGRTFRMPTEAEWEYAARGGKKSRGYKYSGSNSIGDVAWYDENSGRKTHPVRQKQPNELGIYDMSGNVYEWCSDWEGSYSSGSQTNPKGPSSGLGRELRGGSWSWVARSCRVSIRDYINPSCRNSNIGFRLVLVP